MADAQVDQYTFHVEPVDNVAEVCRKVREAGMKVGIAIKPNTPVEAVVWIFMFSPLKCDIYLIPFFHRRNTSKCLIWFW